LDRNRVDFTCQQYTVQGVLLSLFSEIKRRNVVQGVIAYAVAGWIIIQLAIALEAALELPSYVDRWVTIAVTAGFPPHAGCPL